MLIDIPERKKKGFVLSNDLEKFWIDIEPFSWLQDFSVSLIC